jgi:hypothetical protein
MLRVLSEFRKFNGTGGCCCADEAKVIPNAMSNPEATRALFFRRESETFTMFMSKQ